ncbi:MAG: hypothetical protein H6767_00380 [Candidatus Peribacteria bacterium]|nr:MAG: hypothetical protein H6767_00380 [Candidatus Peribacteria bacterium]
MSCGANIAATELGYVMDGLNIYYACYSQAREEQTYIMVDATEKCKDEIQTMTEIDFEKRVSTFQNIKDDSMKILRNFDEQMQNIIDNMDR